MTHILLYTTAALLLLAVITALVSLLTRHRTDSILRDNAECQVLLEKVQRIKQFAAPRTPAQEDAARKQNHLFDVLFSNPFVAVAFYDRRRQLILQNNAMQGLSTERKTDANELPLYNTEGDIDSYLVAISV